MPQGVMALAKLLASDSDPDVRRNAAHGLGLVSYHVGQQAATSSLHVLMTALSDADAGVRRHSAQALGKLGELAKPASSELARLLEDSNSDVRRNAANALKNLGSTGLGIESLPSLVSALGDRSYKVRRNSAVALGKLGAEASGAVVALGCALGDEHKEVRRRAAEALGLIQLGVGPEEAVLLGRALSDEDADTRRVAALALLRLGEVSRVCVGVLELALGGECDKKTRGLIKQVLLALGAMWRTTCTSLPYPL